MMVVCKYYLEGRCYFGNRCRYEHTSPNYQSYADDRQSSGQGRAYHDSYEHQGRGQHYDSRNHGSRGQRHQNYYDDDYYYDDRGQYSGGGSSNYYTERQHDSRDHRSKYTYRAEGQNARLNADTTRSQAQSSDQQLTTSELLNYIREEMEIWETSGMWPFSCFAFMREASSLPGLNDVSMEEVRLNAYEAKLRGDVTAYVSWVTELSNDYAAKRDQLKRPSGVVKEGLVQVIDEVNRVGVPLNTAAGQKPLPVTGCDVPLTVAFDSSSAGGTDTAVQTFVTSSANVFSQPSSSLTVQSSSVLQQASPGVRSVDRTSQPQTASLVYTPLDELTDDDRAQYEAVKFTLGRVPVRPPPKELI